MGSGQKGSTSFVHPKVMAGWSGGIGLGLWEGCPCPAASLSPRKPLCEELHDFCRAQKALATLWNFLAWAELLLGKGCSQNRVFEDTRAQGRRPAATRGFTFLSKCANKKLKSAASISL